MFHYQVNNRYNLRNNGLLKIPLMITGQSQSSVVYRGVKVWNSLPQNIRDNNTITGFKKALKYFLLQKYDESG